MTIRDLTTADMRLLGTAKATKNAATTTNFDFGTPDDLNLAALTNYKHGDKVLVVFTATTAGTTDSISFGVLDAPDSRRLDRRHRGGGHRRQPVRRHGGRGGPHLRPAQGRAPVAALHADRHRHHRHLHVHGRGVRRRRDGLRGVRP
jgi:hypothetical protein